MLFLFCGYVCHVVCFVMLYCPYVCICHTYRYKIISSLKQDVYVFQHHTDFFYPAIVDLTRIQNNTTSNMLLIFIYNLSMWNIALLMTAVEDGILSDLYEATGWCTKCHTIVCAHNTLLLLQKHLTSGTELILIGWKIVPNEEHVQCDHRFASQPLANEPLHSSQLFDTSLQKARGTTSLCGPWAALHFLASLASFNPHRLENCS